jgi:hypothetical protein
VVEALHELAHLQEADNEHDGFDGPCDAAINPGVFDPLDIALLSEDVLNQDENQQTLEARPQGVMS